MRVFRFHDSVITNYDSNHGEIFNDREQQRIQKKLAEAIGLIEPDRFLRALDLGCGSGNLTSHLLKLGPRITAADVSKKFLKIVGRKFSGSGRVETVRINGADLSNFKDDEFDFTATYSVLHHIKDYLGMVKEMARVTSPGGVVYIDHEHSPGYWNKTAEYAAFLDELQRETRPAPKPELSRFMKPSVYFNKFKQLLNPRYIIEGDIHVWPGDNINWEKVECVLHSCGFETTIKEDYLLYRRGYPDKVYDKYKNVCNDMRLVVAKKIKM